MTLECAVDLIVRSVLQTSFVLSCTALCCKRIWGNAFFSNVVIGELNDGSLQCRLLWRYVLRTCLLFINWQLTTASSTIFGLSCRSRRSSRHFSHSKQCINCHALSDELPDLFCDVRIGLLDCLHVRVLFKELMCLFTNLLSRPPTQ